MAIRTTAEVVEIRDETASVYTLIVKTREIIPFEAGQFFFIHMERDGQKRPGIQRCEYSRIDNTRILY